MVSVLGTVGRSRAGCCCPSGDSDTSAAAELAEWQDVPFTAGREVAVAAPSCPHVTAVH